MRCLRQYLLVVVGAILLATSCDGGDDRKRCQGLDDPAPPSLPSPCSSGESCLWVHEGDRSGYFCVETCSQATPCPDGQSCRAGGASSCATCMNLVDICE